MHRQPRLLTQTHPQRIGPPLCSRAGRSVFSLLGEPKAGAPSFNLRTSSSAKIPCTVDILRRSDLPHFGTVRRPDSPPLVGIYRIECRDRGSSGRRAVNTNPIPPTINATPAIPAYGVRL